MKRLATFVVAATGLLLLAACSTTPSGGGPETIQGRVVGLLGSPLPNATVSIGSATATSDGTGAFSIPNVTPPYDATVSSVSGNWAHVYQGLSTATPILFPVGVLAGGTTVTSNATVQGTVTTSVTASSTNPLVVCVEGVNVEVYGCNSYTTPTTATTVDYSITAGWITTSNVAVRVHALQYARATSTSLPSSYYGYAKTTSTTTLVPGNTYSSINLMLMGTMGSNALSGSLSVPAGFTSVGVMVMARVSPTLSIPLGSATLTGPGYAYTAQVPAFTGATSTVLAIGSATGKIALAWKQDLTAGTGRDVSLSQVPTVASLPASASPGDTFNVTGTTGAPLTVVFQPSASPTAPALAMTTSQSSVTLPSTLAIPSGSTYSVLTVSNPDESLDRASGDWLDGYYAVLATSGLAIHADGGATISSPTGTFTVP